MITLPSSSLLELPDHIESAIHEEAYIEACELVSPNSPEFDALLDKLTEEAIDKWYKGISYESF